MKQEEIIKQLKQLNRIEPDLKTLSEIKQDIYFQLQSEEKVSIWDWLKQFTKLPPFSLKANPVMTYGLAALAIFVFLSISTGVLPNTASKIFLSVRIATAPNQYEKAKVVFSYAQTQIDALNKSNNKLDNYKLTDISRTIAFANTELSGLKLMGEKGKYTSEQCKELYRSYHTSLENLDHYITTSSPNEEDKQSIAPLKTQISNYEKQAEQKLKLY